LPISKDEWDTGRIKKTREDRILDFLNKNPDTAFTLLEICSGVGEITQKADYKGMIGDLLCALLFQNALDDLIEADKVEARTIKTKHLETTYYKSRS